MGYAMRAVLHDGTEYKGAIHPDWRPPVPHLLLAGEVVGPDGRDTRVRCRELAVRAAALKEYWIRQARNSFPAFMQYVFVDSKTRRPFAQQWFHDDWSKAMDVYSRLVIVGPRNHGKTAQIVGRIIWELGRNPNLRIKLVCAADSKAKERLFEITQNILYNPRVKDVFPELEPDPDAPWNIHKIHVRRPALHKDASVEALGITSTATGGRCDILVADDAVDRRNALTFPALRTQIKQAWDSDWINLLDPDSKVWVICTLWHKDDLNHKLMANSEYKTLFYAIPENFGSMWVDRWPEDALRARHRVIMSIEFNRGFRNQAVDEETQFVSSKWIVYDDLRKNEEFQTALQDEHLVFFTSYDTASAPTGHKEQDYSASVVIAVDTEAGKIYIIDAWHGRFSLKKMSGFVAKEAAKYKPFRIVIEKAGQGSLHEWVVNDYPELADLIDTPTPKVSKGIRLMSTTPLLERGQVIFSQHLDPDREGWDPGRGSVVNEILDYGFAAHDDLTDAFSQAIHSARRYFLDSWASERQDGDVSIVVGVDPGGDSQYLY